MTLDIKPEAKIFYSPDRWKILSKKRDKAKFVLKILEEIGIIAYAYGSIARGDIRQGSDIDIIIIEPTLPLSLLEEHLSAYLDSPLFREITQATPQSTPKYYIHFRDRITVSLPIGKLREKEEEFYKFGGEVSLSGILSGIRVPGVNKKLKLVVPNKEGHLEYPVKGYEGAVAKVLGIRRESVEERVRVLTKRSIVGTTGLYLNYRLMPRESFEEAVLRLKRQKKGFRKRLSEDFFI